MVKCAVSGTDESRFRQGEHSSQLSRASTTDRRCIKALGKRASAILRRYYLGPDFPMKMRLWGWLRKWGNYPRLTVRYAAAGWITVDERDLLQREILVNGFYEPEVWEALSSLADSEEVFWDVGAHIGTFSVRALLDPRVRVVHAFEPDPLSAEILEFNLRLNDPSQSRWALHRIALSDRRERRRLYSGPDSNTGLSSLVPRPNGLVFEVSCLSADELVFLQGIDSPTLMKIDVESWEGAVIRGAQRLLAEKPPKAIVLEAGYREPGHVSDPSLARYLESWGYTIRHVRRPSGIVEERENFVAVHETWAKRDI